MTPVCFLGLASEFRSGKRLARLFFLAGRLTESKTPALDECQRAGEFCLTQCDEKLAPKPRLVNARHVMSKEARWIKAYVGLVEETKLSMQARLTLIALRSFCPAGRSACYPSTNTLCVKLGCERKALFRYLNELEQRHWIRRSARRCKDKTFSSTKYELLDERKSLMKAAIPSSQSGDADHVAEFPVVKYRLHTREKVQRKRRKIIPLPCYQDGDTI